MPRRAARAFYCYLLLSQRATYIGYTTNLARRLRQHNSELVGGARATRKHSGTWRMHAAVTGFRTASEALSFEYYWKHAPSFTSGKYRSTRGRDGRHRRMCELLQLPKWAHVYRLSNDRLPSAAAC